MDQQPQYTGIDDPALEEQAKQNLRERYPTLTDNDLENLWGFEAERILNPDSSQEGTG